MIIVALRVGYTLLAVCLGVSLIYALTYVGNKTEGPIQKALENVSSGVTKMENKYMMQPREHTRSAALQWFNTYRNDISKLRFPDQILIGAYDDSTTENYESIYHLENALGTQLPVIQLYSAWGSKEDEGFPMLQAQAILNIGSVPMITWEPWLSDFDASILPDSLSNAKLRDANGLKAVAAGVYDFYIDKWAADARKLGKPFFLRMGHEMNDPYRYPWGPQNNEPKDFIAAWQHVVKRFREDGAANAVWVWSPHPAYAYDSYYPGSEYVDWVGVGTLNYGTVANWSQWWSFADIFGKNYTQLAAYNKPVMITEFGSLKVGGDRCAWYSEALSQMQTKYPAVKAVLFYHNSSDNTTTNKSLDWGFKNDKNCVQSIVQAMSTWKK